MTDFVVIRAVPEARVHCPPEFIEGKWYDRSAMPALALHEQVLRVGTAVAAPSGILEVRAADGAVGEVWKLRLVEEGDPA